MDPTLRSIRRDIYLTLKQANEDYQRIKYNTVVSAGMKILNSLEAIPTHGADASSLLREGLSIVLRVLYPVVPHITWTLWRDLDFAREFGELLDARWPAVDPDALAQDEIELVLQVNGKLRGKLVVPAQADEDEIKQRAGAAPEVAKYGSGGPVKFIKVVPGRLVNVVV